jgi:DNA replicative helicase MCM subunit Mcm2 (Cdc46/Mcm family)
MLESVMDKVLFYCYECEHKFEVKYKEIADLPSTKCPKCKSENIFIQKFIYDKEPDRSPIKLGDRGCGTPGRFK